MIPEELQEWRRSDRPDVELREQARSSAAGAGLVPSSQRWRESGPAIAWRHATWKAHPLAR